MIKGVKAQLFQSRNRGSFDFKRSSPPTIGCFAHLFQSRNRGSFDFKKLDDIAKQFELTPSFNLVIEVLLISSKPVTGSLSAI